MTPYLIFDPSGIYVIGCGHYLADGELKPRPLSPAPVEVPGGYQLPNCPYPTAVIIHDLIGGETVAEFAITAEDPDSEFSLEPGTYEIEVTAPLPALPTATRIEVT